MNDYYSQFKPEAEKMCGEWAAKVSNLQKVFAGITKRLTDERDAVRRLQERIQRLKDEAGKSLAGNKNTYERYRNDLTKRARDIEVSRSMVVSLEQLLKNKKVELAEAEVNLKNSLRACLIQHRDVADARIEDLLRQCLQERQDFLDAWTRIYAGFGQGFLVNDEAVCPGVWSASECEGLKAKLDIAVRQRAARNKSAEPIPDEPTASEPTPDTPEAAPVVEPERPEITVLTGEL